MTDIDAASTVESTLESQLIDLTGVSLNRLRVMDDTLLTGTIRQVLADLADGPRLFAFESGLTTP